MAFAASPLRHPQPFFAPKALDLLVIDDPAFAAGVVIGGPEPAPRMILGVVRAARPATRHQDPRGSSTAGSWRWVARCCPVTRQANRSLTPSTRWR